MSHITYIITLYIITLYRVDNCGSKNIITLPKKVFFVLYYCKRQFFAVLNLSSIGTHRIHIYGRKRYT